MKNIRFIIGILLLGVAMSMSAAKKFTLVIDAGHGGGDEPHLEVCSCFRTAGGEQLP